MGFLPSRHWKEMRPCFCWSRAVARRNVLQTNYGRLPFSLFLQNAGKLSILFDNCDGLVGSVARNMELIFQDVLEVLVGRLEVAPICRKHVMADTMATSYLWPTHDR